MLRLRGAALDLGGERGQDRVVDPAEALGGEGALEEAADAGRTLPPGGGDHLAAARAGRGDRPGGDEGGVAVGLDQLQRGGRGDVEQAVAHALAGGLQPPVHDGAGALAALAHLVLAELLRQHPAAGARVVGEGVVHPLRLRRDDPLRGGLDLRHDFSSVRVRARSSRAAQANHTRFSNLCSIVGAGRTPDDRRRARCAGTSWGGTTPRPRSSAPTRSPAASTLRSSAASPSTRCAPGRS
ncbi:hypothetical protein SBRY_60134 [Actinacidiphila bryophytorum]|uniref:Uncharacterized protein n=1 Tax=Actinacidiphila bryophytorum TaxID=1436133 RepID=A0A9W4H5Y5_9ACTN|nr:hypothetical protein SBRY_60134 [Actinacidiphila bryophytorum]